MTYAAALEWLYATQWHGIKLGLANMERLVAALEIPLRGEGAPRFIHVAGTNGKGSVCAMAESILRAVGVRTGLYTSPHLVDFRERVQVSGEMISEAAVAEGLTHIRGLTESWEHSPTFFEITTALALWHFARAGVEVAVLETGMGGRLDATNIVTPLVSVITPIALDHQQYLGETLGQIAGEKAGIIKAGVPVVLAPQAAEARAVLQQVAAERSAPLVQVSEPWDGPAPGLAGEHQRWNAAVAVAALQAGGIALPAEVVATGLREVQWPGRFQEIAPRVFVDGAHNPAAARVLAATWRERFGEARCTLIMGMAADKEVRAVCEELRELPTRVIAVPIRNPRTLAAEALCAVWREVAPEVECKAAAEFSSALESVWGFTEPVLIAGSLFLVGEAIAHFTAQGALRTSLQ